MAFPKSISRVVSQERHDFYVRFINSCVDARKKSQETRNDILQAIIDIEKKAMAEGKPGGVFMIVWECTLRYDRVL